MNNMTVLEALKEFQNSKDTGIRFAGPKNSIVRRTSSELIANARRFAGGLLQRGVQAGSPVILVMTEPESAITAILGCMIAHCPPTPIYPPMNLRAVPNFLRFVQHVADRSRAAFIVSDPQPYGILGNTPTDCPPIQGIDRFGDVMQIGREVEIDRHDQNIAFLQFTSGSTSTPKGIIVEHRGLAENLRMIREASRMVPESCVVTWLPVYHDMGLIGTVLNAITLPCELVVIPPILFLKNPRLWLELISRFRGTHTAAPNFAYGLCVRRVEQTEGLDLGSMTTFICGAEPVMPQTMEEFVRFYSDAGLKPGAMVPAYGLAEATLAVTFTEYMRGFASDEVELESLSAGRFAKPAHGEERILRICACGVPLSGLSVRIASENDDVLNDRQIGEIQIAGSSLTPGYIGDADATRSARTPDGWLRTGDLGYMVSGELYPCGRIKDVIIIRGKNFHAHDLESAASEVKGIRTGNVVAFSSRDESGESLVIIAETKLEGRNQELSREIRTHLAQTIGIAPDNVVVVPPGTLPKTSSGKLKRSETRSLYATGKLGSRPGTLAAISASLASKIGFLRGKN